MKPNLLHYLRSYLRLKVKGYIQESHRDNHDGCNHDGGDHNGRDHDVRDHDGRGNYSDRDILATAARSDTSCTSKL